MNAKKLNRFNLVMLAVLCVVLAGCSAAYMDHEDNDEVLDTLQRIVHTVVYTR